MNLEWLSSLISNFPEPKKARRNIIEISGYPSWENVISNLLAFYFDTQEEHKFNNLFLESLVELIHEKGEVDFRSFILESNVSVERERHRIDILIRGYNDSEDDEDERSDWAIIIENKIGASLYNKLDVYWNAVEASEKVGVVLSINPVNHQKLKLKEENVKFINILHDELNERIQSKLSIAFRDGDDRHLLFLKEYLANISDKYEDKIDDMKHEKILLSFHEKRKDIQKFHEVDNELLIFVSEAVFTVLEDFGFVPNSQKKTSKGKHFFADTTLFRTKVKQHTPSEYRIWVNLGKLRYDRLFEAYFELDGKENAQYGSKVKRLLRTQVKETKYVSFGEGGSDNAGYQHIYKVEIPLEGIEEYGFKDVLSNTLKWGVGHFHRKGGSL